MLSPVLAAVALLSTAQTQDRPPAPPSASVQDETRVEDIVVEGRRLGDLARDFVGEVAAPNGNRGLARWNDGVCVGVVNLKTDMAQYIADRVSTVAQDLGVTTGQPGCSPNILVVATDDGKALAREMVATRRTSFHMGASGTDRGYSALSDFQTSDRPIRWWHVSLPVDSETGQVATRIPGQVNGDGSSIYDYAPVISVSAASRLRSQIRDDLNKVIIVVDIDDLGAVNLQQLGDYVSMVALAQVDPEARTGEYNTILNMFADPTATGLTEWDQAYLTGLYGAEQNRINPSHQRGAIAALIARERREASAGDAE